MHPLFHHCLIDDAEVHYSKVYEMRHGELVARVRHSGHIHQHTGRFGVSTFMHRPPSFLKKSFRDTMVVAPRPKLDQMGQFMGT
ncbi:hypothetical protein QQP08_007632 [Theobroma cacao]|nr:hypothetical protein QQP08_007632 [Theobroma cacao]